MSESQLTNTSISTATNDLENDLEDVENQYGNVEIINLDHATFKDKMDSLKYNWLALVSLISVYTFQYTTTSGVNPTIKLTESAGTFYKWASVALRVGNFTGRISVTFVQVPYIVLLILAGIAFLIMMLFIFESAFRFINNGMVLIFIMPIMGLCSGIIYSDAMFWI